VISRRNFLHSAVSSLAAARFARAQDATTFTADVNVVSILATVRDRQGKIVRDLTRNDFLLEEDGRPQTIRYFSQESDLPLTLGLLIDTSGSQRQVLGQERAASYRFLDQVLGEDKDLAFVIHFDHEVELLQDLTSSRKKLEAALADIELPERQRRGGGFPGGGYPGGGYPGGGGRGRRTVGAGGTELYDSVLLASDEIMKKQSGRKALILLTDGVDVGSHVGLKAAIEAAQRSDTLVYSILFADPEGYGGFGSSRGGRRGRSSGRRFPMPDGKPALERFSSETGGAFFQVSDRRPLDEIYRQLEEQLRNQYSIGYTPDRAGQGPGYRKIRLSVRRTDLQVQTRDGYYART
jgi:VWFA-related protein